MNTLRVLGLASCVLFSSLTLAETVTIRADEWFPMNGVPDSENEGYMIDLAREIFAAKGLTVEYKIRPWARAVTRAKLGKIDCIVGTYADEEGLVYPEESWGMDESIFFVKADDPWRYTGLASLEAKKVGLIGEYEYSKEITEMAAANPGRFQILGANNALEQNIKKVLAGRVDTTIESPLVMRAKLKELGLSGQLVEAGRLADPTAMYIGCSAAKPSSKDLVKWVDEGTRELRANGKLKAILDKYGLSDWK